MTEPMTFNDPRLAELDGFRVDIDAGNERADIILARPPYNVISMGARDQLRLVFEALDAPPAGVLREPHGPEHRKFKLRFRRVR